MLKLISKYNDMYAIYDDSDDVTDIVTESEIKLLLNIGQSIDGVTRVDDDNISIASGVQQLTSLDVQSEEEAFENEEDDDFDMSFDDGYDDSDSFDGDEESEYDDFDDEYSDYDEEDEDEEDDSAFDDIAYEDWYGDEDEDSMLEESVVNKLYSILTAEQLAALRKYYLWYSRRLFAEATHDTTFGMTNKKRIQAKKQVLDGLKNKNANAVWKYAGFIDMGRKGDGFCELGHPLRYMHIAWDTSVEDIDTAFFGENYEGKFDEAIESENSIVFGIKCIADFFEVDKELILQLQSAQRESLKDMAIMYDFYEKGIADEVMKQFAVLDEFMDLYKRSWMKAQMMGVLKDTDFSQALMSFYIEFRKLNMIPPKSMVQEIRDKLIGWNEHKFSGNIRYPEIDKLSSNLVLAFNSSITPLTDLIKDCSFNNKYARNGRPYAYSFNDGLFLYLTNYFVYKICGTYEWGRPKYDFSITDKYTIRKLEKNDVWSDEGGWSDKVKGYQDDLNYSLSRHFFSEPEYNSAYIRKIVECITLAKKYIYRDEKFYTNYAVRRDDNLLELSEDIKYCEEYYQVFSDETHSSLYSNIRKLESLHSRSLYSSIEGRYNKAITIDEKIAEVNDIISCIDSELPKFKEWFPSYIKKYIDDTNISIREEIERKAREEEERRKREEELARKRAKEEAELEKKRLEMEEEESRKQASRQEVLDYLKDADITPIQNNSKFAFQLKVLNSFKKYGKASDKQFVYLKDIYDALHGKTDIQTDHRQDKVMLDTKPELKVALEWYVVQTSGIDEKTKNICNSILKYGSISERQMKYAEVAKELYDKSEK